MTPPDSPTDGEPAAPTPHSEPVDPRITRTRQVVHEAVLAQLAEQGVTACTVESIAQRSGVAKSTLYRHWSGRLDLVADALRAHSEQPTVQAVEGSVRSAVTTILVHLADSMADPVHSPRVPALVEAAERDEAVAAVFHADNRRRRQPLVDLLAAGVDNGEFDATIDAELAAVALAGAIVYRRLLTGTPMPRGNVHQLIDTVLGPEPGSGSAPAN